MYVFANKAMWDKAAAETGFTMPYPAGDGHLLFKDTGIDADIARAAAERVGYVKWRYGPAPDAGPSEKKIFEAFWLKLRRYARRNDSKARKSIIPS